VVGADAGAGDDREGVVVLEEELACRVEADRGGTCLVEQSLRALGDPPHGVVPIRLHEAAALPDERPSQPVRRVVGLPPIEVLGSEAALVHATRFVASHPDDAFVLDGDVEGIPVGVEDRRRKHPVVHVLGGNALLEEGIDTSRPALAVAVGRARAPRLGDAVDRAAREALGANGCREALLRELLVVGHRHPPQPFEVTPKPGT
jgi:hypothetical protein